MTTETGRRWTGQPVARIEDRDLLEGRARFADDIELPGMLHLAFARTERPHAKVLAIDKTRAERVPGVVAVLVHADLTGPAELTPRLERPGIYSPPRPLLAADRVRFVGEAVAAVLAVSRYAAEDACDELEVEYEDLVPVADTASALHPDAPVVHPDAAGNTLLDHRFDSGRVPEALAAAPIRFRKRFEVARVAPSPMEGRGVVVEPGPDGITMWTSTQAPHQIRRALEPLLGVPVRVVCPNVGGGFGQKAHVYPEELLVAWLALQRDRPVKWIEDRRENLLCASHARGQVIDVEVAAKSDGTLLAVDADIVADMGAYGMFPHGHILEALGTPNLVPGPYRLPAYRYRTRAVATNKSPGGAYRGVGVAVSAFVHERIVDCVARRAGVAPLEVRRRNLVPAHAMPYTTVAGLHYDSGDYRAALDLAASRVEDSASGLRRGAEARGNLFGVGYSVYVETTGMGSEVFTKRGMVGIAGYDDARLVVNGDGSVTVHTSLPSAGQGLATSFAQLVADELSLPLSRVQVAPVDTNQVTDGTGTFGSRSAAAGGAAILKASAVLRQRLRDLAAAELEAGEWDLVLEEGRFSVAGVPSRGRTFAELAAVAPPGRLDVEERYDPAATAFAYGAHACAVEVNPRTGTVVIVRHVVAEDCGPLINPRLADGQTHGATAQGIGAALLEAVRYAADGQPLTGSLADYLLPLATDLPQIEILHLVHPSPMPGGYKGVAEGGTVAAPAAVANAVSDAIGVDVDEIPITPDLVLSLLAQEAELNHQKGEEREG